MFGDDDYWSCSFTVVNSFPNSFFLESVQILFNTFLEINGTVRCLQNISLVISITLTATWKEVIVKVFLRKHHYLYFYAPM